MIKVEKVVPLIVFFINSQNCFSKNNKDNKDKNDNFIKCCKSCKEDKINKIKKELKAKENELVEFIKNRYKNIDDSKLICLTDTIYTDNLIAESVSTFLEDKDKVKKKFEYIALKEIENILNNRNNNRVYIISKTIKIEDIEYYIFILSEKELSANYDNEKNSLILHGITYEKLNDFLTSIKLKTANKKIEKLEADLNP